GAARCLVGERGSEEQRAQAARVLEVLERDRQAEDLLDLSEFATRGGQRERFASYEAARKAVEQAALDELATRDRALLQELLEGFARSYAGAKERESGVDFAVDDALRCGGRPVQREEKETGRGGAGRFRAVMAEVFRQTIRLEGEWICLTAGFGFFFGGENSHSFWVSPNAEVGLSRPRR